MSAETDVALVGSHATVPAVLASGSVSTAQRVLVVTDDADGWAHVSPQLSERGFELAWAVSASHAVLRLEADAHDYGVVLCDLRERENLELCEALLAHDRTLAVVVSCDDASIELAVRATRLGVTEFVTRPLALEALCQSFERAGAQRVASRRERVGSADRFGELFGSSAPMRGLFRQLQQLADSSVTSLVRGESGVGKELVARSLHFTSRRRAAPFVVVNCAALPESLLDSELFGHEPGAFTDARVERLGLFREAAGGTLFLDDVSELPMALQPKLLRVLQERVVRPLGASREVPVDVRIVCATNVDLRDAVAQGRFREDLYYRLEVVQLEVPPLRARGADVLLLAETYLSRRVKTDAPSLSLEVAARFLEYEWPGNVRELFNVLESALSLYVGSEITEGDLPDAVRQATRRAVPNLDDSALRPWAEVEKRYILRVMAALNGNKRRAATLLGLDRSTLHRKLQAWS